MQSISRISSKWGWALIIVVVADTISTAFQLHLGWIKEANPLMNFYVNEGGILVFCFMKLFIFSSPLLITTECGVRKNMISKKKAGIYYAVTTIIYLLLLILMVIYFNI